MSHVRTVAPSGADLQAGAEFNPNEFRMRGNFPAATVQAPDPDLLPFLGVSSHNLAGVQAPAPFFS